jgi:hypothetical protein
MRDDGEARQDVGTAAMPTDVPAHGLRLPFPIAAAVVLALAAPYVVLNTAFPGPVLTYAGGFVVAGAALGALWLAGLPPWRCFVRIALASRQGAFVLALLSLFIPAVLLAGRGQPLSPLDDLVYAPASALGQELYFRAALLTVLLRLSHGRPLLARLTLPLSALLFALWHLRAFRVVAPAPALAVLFITFIAGMFWAWQARRDGTMLYTFAQHTLFLIVQ